MGSIFTISVFLNTKFFYPNQFSKFLHDQFFFNKNIYSAEFRYGENVASLFLLFWPAVNTAKGNTKMMRKPQYFRPYYREY